MTFTSQFIQSKTSSRRNSDADILLTQNYKKSTDSQEMSIRVSSAVLAKVGLKIGDKVDVLWDEENIWRIIKTNRYGFTISGKENSPTQLIRYTLKKGHHKLTEKTDELPVREEFSDDELELDIENNSITFCKIYSAE